MKIDHTNPQDLPDPEVGGEVNPALEAAVKTLAEGLQTVGMPDAHFVMLVLVPTKEVDRTTLRIASNIEPDAVKELLRDIGNEGEDMMSMSLAFGMINAVCRVAKAPPMTPAQFVVLARKLADKVNGEHPGLILPH